MAITVYSTENCVRCDMTKKALAKEGLEYTEIRTDLDPEARAYVVGLGYLRAPVVVTDTGHWSGFRRDLIKGLAAS